LRGERPRRGIWPRRALTRPVRAQGALAAWRGNLASAEAKGGNDGQARARAVADG